MIDPRTLAESGILLVDKPETWTSHDVVNCIRRRFKVAKVGHCGTLDPNATGLLVIVLGRATKLAGRLSGQDKVYSGTMCLGVETSTQDREGTVTATREVGPLTPERIEEEAAHFRGDIQQIPPMVSAVKKDGRPLYKLARKGIEIERDPRPVRISELTFTGYELPFVHFRVVCSKGTYVRTLCADLGTRLGCGAHLHALRRLASGRFSVDGAVTIDTIKTWEREHLLANMIPLTQVLAYL